MHCCSFMLISAPCGAAANCRPRALLEANLFLYGRAGPALAASPGTERVTMAHHYVLEEVDADELYWLLINITGKARQWREDYFLDQATNPLQLHAPSASAAMTLAR